MSKYTFEERARHFANTDEDQPARSLGLAPKEVAEKAMRSAGYSESRVKERLRVVYGED